MKKLLALILGICLLATSALAADATWGTPEMGWAGCNTGGGYGGWNGNPFIPCKVVWDGVVQACTDSTRDATFTVGQDNYYTTSITIEHLDGFTDDSFEIKDGDTVICSYTDSTSSETWMPMTCDGIDDETNVDDNFVPFIGQKTLTIHPTVGPWCCDYGGCDVWGQVAIRSITYELGDVIPEFSAIAAGLALAGAATGFVLLRKRK